MIDATVSDHWDLWLLRALRPTATAADLDALLRARLDWYARLRGLPQRLLEGDRDLVAPGRELLAADPALRSGVLLTLHMGPYPCVLEPFLAAGLAVTVVASERCCARWRPMASELSHRLGYRGRIDWLVPSGDAASMGPIGRRLRQAVEAGGLVVLFADGFGPGALPLDAIASYGAASMTATRRAAGRSISYSLPGREVRVPLALARWLCKEELPVHPVSVRWSKDGRDVLWRRQATQRWSARHDSRTVAQLLHDWIFHEVVAEPAQWSGWSMLVPAVLASAGSGDAGGRRDRDAVPAGLQEDYRRALQVCLDRAAATVRVELEAELAVWPGSILADLTHDRFYTAAGLREQDLAVLRAGIQTLAELDSSHGRAWVEKHVLRLCLLGVARLRTTGPTR